MPSTVIPLRAITIYILIGFVYNFSMKSDSGEDIQTMPEEGDTWAVDASVGKAVTIKIRGNPTTGYGWYLKNRVDVEKEAIISATNLNEYGSGDYATDPHQQGMVGVPGYYYFKFSPLKAGKTQLVFEHKRAWEQTAHRTVSVDVTIQ